MKRFELNLNYFNELCGLSCVENLLLFILSANGIKDKVLFYDSYIDLAEIEGAFIYEDITYANFTKIKRLQNVATELGIIKMHLIDTSEIPPLCENFFYCVLVNDNFMKNKFNRHSWREDHYILLFQFERENYCYVNDVPKYIGDISKSEFEQYYGGKIIAFELMQNEKSLDYRLFNNVALEKMCTEKKEHILTCDNILMLRDIIGILKVLRRRLSIYFDIQYDTQVQAYFKLLEESYAILQYMIIRNRYDNDKVNNIKSKISIMDNDFINLIRSKCK